MLSGTQLRAAGFLTKYPSPPVSLEEPLFFPEPNWILIPLDFSQNIVSGKGYDTSEQACQLL
jgi:hypothetical protein